VLSLVLVGTGAGAEERASQPSWLDALDRRLGDAVSPRALARAHASLEGIRQCSECHDGLAATPDALCLDCHEDVAARQQGRIGWHGALAGRCADCHADHRGEAGDILGLDRKSWNHELARFPLRGAHASVECDDCHQRAGADGAVGFHAQGIAFERCADCHADVHGAGFAGGRDCGACHREASFRSDSLVAAAFDHERDAGFALTGEHAEVSCAGCHTEGLRAVEQAARSAPGSHAPRDCAGCHEDPHAGAIGDACASCHTPARWSAGGDGAAFDHARDTRFALDRLHAGLACGACHDGLTFAAAGSKCADCHAEAVAFLAGRAAGAVAAPDPHAAAAQCRDCHAESVATPRLLDYERACLACHPAAYGSLLLTKKRIVDDLVVRAESALRSRALARERGEPAGAAARDAQVAARVAAVAKSGLHHAGLSEAALLTALEALTTEEGGR
jgi:hypothetical protein